MDMDGPYYSHRAEKAQDVPWELPLLFPYLLSIQLRYIFSFDEMNYLKLSRADSIFVSMLKKD